MGAFSIIRLTSKRRIARAMHHGSKTVCEQVCQVKKRLGGRWGERKRKRERDCVCKTNLNPAHCDRFLCSDTLACVNEPKECPCPFVEQKRCELGDTYVCVQQSNCHEAERMYSL